MIDAFDAVLPQPVLSREMLARYRLHLLGPGVRELSDLRLPESVVHFLQREIVPSHAQRHHLGALLVDGALRPIAYTVPYLGYLRGLRVDPRAFLAPALILGAAGLILFHQRTEEHPTPSRADLRIARRVRDDAELVGLRLLDHLLLADDDRWTSLRLDGRLQLPSLRDPAPSCTDRRRQVKAKYRNPECLEETWSGRGQMARWLRDKLTAGARLEDFVVED